ncbi:MAG: GDSL-type esterase/lipase family protein [Alistipes communis]
MKRLVALWLCATVWLSAGGQSRDWANTGRYAAANAALAVRPKVVFIGDSITEEWYSAHPSFFDANGFAARGISGQVTAQMLARFQCDVVALRPRAVVILAGTNDIARNNGPIDEERIADNIRSMAELARAHGMRVFLCSVLPAARYGWRPEVTDAPDRIDRLNRMLREYALTTVASGSISTPAWPTPTARSTPATPATVCIRPPTGSMRWRRSCGRI